MLFCVLPLIAGVNGPFLLDDASNIEGARASTGSIGEIVHAIFKNDTGLLRRPLANLSFLLNRSLFGPAPFSFKLFNIMLHWINACLLWRLATNLIRSLYPRVEPHLREQSGLFIAALWALHPMQISTVLYSVQRMAEMSATFTIIALLVFMRYMRDWSGAKSIAVVTRSLALFAILALGMAAKENATLFPIFAILIYFVSAKDVQKLYLSTRSGRQFFAMWTWLPMIFGFAVVVLFFSWLTANYAAREYRLSDRLMTEPAVLIHYLSAILFPDIRLMGLYVDDMPLRHANEPVAWLILVIAITTPVVAFWQRRKAPALAFGLLWFVAAHLLESTFLPLEIAFEHRNYLALFGPMFAFGYYFIKVINHPRLRVIKAAVVLPLALLGAVSLVRAHQWSDGEMFLRHEVENHPNSPRAQNATIELDIESGNLDQAVKRVAEVQRLKPGVFWPLSLDFNLACGIAGHEVRWDNMLEQIATRPTDPSIMGLLSYDAKGYLTEKCDRVPPAKFDAFLVNVTEIYRNEKMLVNIEQVIVLRSYLARAAKDAPKVRKLLKDASESNPSGIIALSDLSYFELNAGDTDNASVVIAELERRVKRWTPTHQFEVDELHQYLSQAKAEKALK